MEEISTSIVVAGTGPAGLAASLKLARAGFAVVLVGPDVVSRDNRTTALMAPALELLDQVGVLDLVRPHAQPLATMRIIDATPRLVSSPDRWFHASDIGELYFGLNIANRDLNRL